MPPLNNQYSEEDERDEQQLDAFSVEEREALACKLLASLPRSSLVRIHRGLLPMLQIDIIGLLPTEIALLILTYLPYSSLLNCSYVSRRWNTLVSDQSIWKSLCESRGWEWKYAPDVAPQARVQRHTEIDEGVGDDEFDALASLKITSLPYQSDESLPGSPVNEDAGQLQRPDYKLLYRTRLILRDRIRTGTFRLRALQTHGTPNSHAGTIYCLQLFCLPDNRQVLFTGSRDTTVRQWNITTGAVERVISGVHVGSVLSLCAKGQYLATAGSDCMVVVWSIADGRAIKTIIDHSESVLCVRFDETRLVSCSKDHTIRTYLFPDLQPHRVLTSHRAAVNAVALSGAQIVSASGDRTVILWDANTGAPLQRIEGQHARGIAAIDFLSPFIVTGSSDKHVRLFDISNPLLGWTTDVDVPLELPQRAVQTCEACGGDLGGRRALRRWSKRRQEAHDELVRTVGLSDDFVISGSYDHTIKVWDKKSGSLLVTCGGGHVGRVFCVDFDCTKIVSCGEDERICIWDFAHNLDTSFIKPL